MLDGHPNASPPFSRAHCITFSSSVLNFSVWLPISTGGPQPLSAVAGHTDRVSEAGPPGCISTLEISKRILIITVKVRDLGDSK